MEQEGCESEEFLEDTLDQTTDPVPEDISEESDTFEFQSYQ